MNMKKITKALLVALVIFVFSGCSYFNIGEPKGSCEELGCDYADAGVCGDVFQIYQTRYTGLDKAYEYINCSNCIKGDSFSLLFLRRKKNIKNFKKNTKIQQLHCMW